MKEIKFSTEVEIKPPDWKLTHRSKILTIGSCFADVLGDQLGHYKFSVANNDFGNAFNPLAICKILDSVIEQRKPNADLYIENPDQIWLHHDFHSSQWARTKADLESSIMEKMKSVQSFLSETDLLVITFGTAYAYRHKRTNQIIGNCHKMPGENFVRELLHPDQITIPFEQLIQKLLTFRRNLRIVLTVSPVRHTKDTLPLNQLSKSVLRLVCHRLSEKYKPVEYFPSYEIMIDELRDYRFYKEDLIHPNKVAEEFIFNAFTRAYLDEDAQGFMKQWDQVAQSIQHRPQHGHTPSQLKLLKNVRDKLNAISRQVDVSAELAQVTHRIAEFSG
ncbi:GSCFA domain-containing protein [Dyadobacter sp. CY323]|uniref:GSCFA domain-containing protein n=1 Tax=Dyadobacter sp. CY323 TaxID=2907302 RepID=UPI001F264C0B|nr:GSCFA domain-containing protein [Dyadobacter sp. CY323]MCE6992347.1 GSCFA domain-containing protein [Dyadobacter sp. CY323]